jgi:hypothetical protein
MNDGMSKHKGDREVMTARPPREVANIIKARAIRMGVPYGDLISAILSEYVGLSYLMPMPQEQPQQELDLPRIA